LPAPLIPSTSRNGQPRVPASIKRSRSCSITRVRPKNTGACASSNASRPRNGEPLVATDQVLVPAENAFWRSSHWRMWPSTCASNSSVLAKL
jgi:hypothetical protein